MTDSAETATSELTYEAPDFQVHGLAAIVLSGPTGGGDTGQTGRQENFDAVDPEPEEEDFYGPDW